jgi:hypothetical protein
MNWSLARRTGAAIGAVTFCLAASIALPGVASATPTNLGALTVAPAAGAAGAKLDVNSALDVFANGVCPDTTQTVVVKIAGGAWSALPDGYGFLVGSTPIHAALGSDGKLHLPVPETLAQIAKDNGITWTPGVYTVTLACVDKTIDLNGIATFSEKLTFKDTANFVNGVVATPGTIKVKTAPALQGTFKVGKKVTVTAGAFSAARLTYHYSWTRDGKAIKGAIRSYYVLAKADKAHRVGVIVTVSKTGYKTLAVTVKGKLVS